ncbi:hypothetical protein VNO78_34929 [Psophocarpus tetragonolobus]|uniref:Uncharacterized protein n=1 Tax=Psophocarpus tetragonolobus TaxID=3891 RepID=A0AAN9NNM4_PSOTE
MAPQQRLHHTRNSFPHQDRNLDATHLGLNHYCDVVPAHEADLELNPSNVALKFGSKKPELGSSKAQSPSSLCFTKKILEKPFSAKTVLSYLLKSVLPNFLQFGQGSTVLSLKECPSKLSSLRPRQYSPILKSALLNVLQFGKVRHKTSEWRVIEDSAILGEKVSLEIDFANAYVRVW